MSRLMHGAISIVIISVTTIIMRSFPFWFFRNEDRIPQVVIYLGRVLPCAMIGMLVIYALKDVSIKINPYGIPELISITVVILTYIWKRNTLISIGFSTVLYMLLVQTVFAS